MKPDVQKVMVRSFACMATDIAPAITAEYAAGSAMVIGLMMFQTATEFDRAAENLVQDNRGFREIFLAALTHVEEGGLKTKLKEAAETKDGSLRISDLDQANSALSELLIELQTYVEMQKGSWARDLETQIWAELVRGAEARRLPHPMVDLSWAEE